MGVGGTRLEPKVRSTEAQKEPMWRAYAERVRLRERPRLYGVSIGTVLRWIQKSRFPLPGSRDPVASRGRGRAGGFGRRKDWKVWTAGQPPVGGLKLIGASGRPTADPPFREQAVGPAGSYRVLASHGPSGVGPLWAENPVFLPVAGFP